MGRPQRAESRCVGNEHVGLRYVAEQAERKASKERRAQKVETFKEDVKKGAGWSRRATNNPKALGRGSMQVLLVLLEVRVLHRTTCKRACGTVPRNRAKPGWRAPEAQGWQEPERRWLAGGANLTCGGSGGRGPGAGDESWMGLMRRGT